MANWPNRSPAFAMSYMTGPLDSRCNRQRLLGLPQHSEKVRAMENFDLAVAAAFAASRPSRLVGQNSDFVYWLDRLRPTDFLHHRRVF